MNFLPHDIKRKRQKTQQLIKIAAAQAVIFFAIILLVAAVSAAKSRQAERLKQLNTALATEIFAESQAIIEQIEEHHARENLQHELPQILELPFFDAEMLSAKISAMPSRSRLISMDITETDKRFVFAARQICYVDTHIANWRILLRDSEAAIEPESVALHDGEVVYVIVITPPRE